MALNGKAPFSVAIIGAGPAGYYTAEALSADHLDIHVDIIDRLPTPYGLIRAGVAPDHQSIKNVSKRYATTNSRDNVHFIGNLELGRDISIQELKALYDVVILATGAPSDRILNIDGEHLENVYGSGKFVGWYNSHPDYKDLKPNLNTRSAAIIGNGNVAIDVARILAKTANEMADTDLADYAADRIHSAPLKDIYIIGRRGPLEAAFTPKELGELNKLDNCVPLVSNQHLPSEGKDEELTGCTKKNINLLRQISCNEPSLSKINLHLLFYRKPIAVEGPQSITSLSLEETELIEGKVSGTGNSTNLNCGLLVTCIGYKSSPIADVPYDTGQGIYANKDGHIEGNLYCVGWARRGPTGTIGTNKPDGKEIAAKILQEISPQRKQGRAGLEALISERDLHIVTFASWKKIDAAEQAAAQSGAPRVKFTNIEEMVEIAES